MSCYCSDEFHELYDHCHADCCTIMVMVLGSCICMSLCLYVIMSFMSLCSLLSYCNVDCCIIMVMVLVLYKLPILRMSLCHYVIVIHFIRLLCFFLSLCNIYTWNIKRSD